MNVIERNNVQIRGAGPRDAIFAHGFGCDQNMWRYVAPQFESTYRTILFDHVGAGRSDISQYDRKKYATLQGYADDILEICEAVNAREPLFVGHSVSAMMGVLAAIKRPRIFSRVIMVGPSPCYINDGAYVGGFNRPDIEGLLTLLESNHLGWSSSMAPVIMGNPDRPELAQELTESFCRTNPEIAREFARVTFMSDNRADLHSFHTPSLILQCSEDVIAPRAVGEYLHRQWPESTLRFLNATGHCPNLSAPEETVTAMKEYLASA